MRLDGSWKIQRRLHSKVTKSIFLLKSGQSLKFSPRTSDNALEIAWQRTYHDLKVDGNNTGHLDGTAEGNLSISLREMQVSN